MDREQQRFHAAVAAMQAIITGDITNPESGATTHQMASRKGIKAEAMTAEFAVCYADALLAELDRTKPKPVTPSPDKDGWIPYAPGGPLPCPENARILIKTQGGYESEEWHYAFTFDWDHNEDDPDENIIAWKPA